jgi:transcriptional regulator with GAF, ATPase, and Fis domain
MRLEILQDVGIAVSQERSLAVVLRRIVEGLARSGGIALARLWLFGPDNNCEVCTQGSLQSEANSSLHLAASAGRPVHPRYRHEDWSRLNGEFHRVLPGIQKVGTIGSTGKPVLVKRIEDDHKWILKPDWAKSEKIRSFAGHPLIFRGEKLGVMAVFCREPLGETEFEWLRVFASAASVAIANSRAFEEVEKLRQRLEAENGYLREEIKVASGGTTMLGGSSGIRRVLEQIEMVAPTDATVLIIGETGVGKELVARAIHERSPRRDGPLIKVNCTAIPRELFEAEFFGHVKGSFSGALRDRAGRFQTADTGSLFLDEIGDLPIDIQPKLLRVLEQGEFEAVGDDETRRANVRIIAASNRDLKSLVQEGRFREDLYYRLSIFPIELPPLRERKDDIPLLAAHFFEEACRRLNRPGLELTEEHFRQLRNYRWPGNIRELRNVIDRAVITARSGSIHFDLPVTESGSAVKSRAPREWQEVIRDEEMKRRERENILVALRQANGRIYGPDGAAHLLGVKPTTLSARIKSLGIKPMARDQA